jgi:hypothetical protein
VTQRVILTTCQRQVPAGQPSGYVYVVDLESRQLLQRSTGIEPAFRRYDLNPRGGMRGMRGIAVRGGQIALANYSSVFLFDSRWRLQRILTDPCCAGIHELAYDGPSLWVTSTASDRLVRYDQTGRLSEILAVRDQAALTQALGAQRPARDARASAQAIDFRDRRNFSTELHDAFHLNGVVVQPGGGLLISLGLISSAEFSGLMNLKSLLLRARLWPLVLLVNRKLRGLFGIRKRRLTDLLLQPARWRSAVVRVDAAGKWSALLVIRGIANPGHSVRLLSDGSAVYLDTSHGAVVHFDPRTGRLLNSTEVTAEGFLRGAVEIAGGGLLLGAGNELLLYDPPARRVTAHMPVAADAAEAIHGLELLPPEFDLPPASLEARLAGLTESSEA